jgi:type I restriction enzyme S subunit
MTPPGWTSAPLSTVVSQKIVYGIVQAGPHDPQGVPYLKSSDVGGTIKEEHLQKTSNPIHEKFGRSKIIPGDIVISLRGNTGATSIVPPDLVEANLTQGTARISVSRDHDHVFVRYQITSSETQRLINAATKGSTFAEITLDDLRKIEILCPPLPEQRRIAEILSTWDRAIETVEALIANARAQKAALMQQLLTGKRRLPGFSGEWAAKPLGTVCKISKGEQLGRLDMVEGAAVPVINGGISPSGYTHRANSAAPSITISEGGNSCGFVSLITEPFWCGGHCYSLDNPTVDRSFLFASLKHREGEIMNLRVGSGLPNIQKKALSDFDLSVPPEREQQAIGSMADLQDRHIHGLEFQLAALRREKAALMQQLLTGKRRVKLPETAAA